MAAMIMVLLGIDQLFTGRFNADNDKARRLRDELENERDVITDSSLFSSIVTSKQMRDNNNKQIS